VLLDSQRSTWKVKCKIKYYGTLRGILLFENLAAFRHL
jgi:hypothetical protein